MKLFNIIARCSFVSIALIATAYAEPYATVTVDLSSAYSIEGIDKFERKKFINMHSSQSEGEWESDEMRRSFLRGWNVNLGREVGQTKAFINAVHEDPNMPGYPSIDHLKELCAKSREEYNGNKELHQYEPINDLVVSTHIHPFYPVGKKTEQGYAMKDGEATATFLAHYFKEGFGDRDGVHGQPKPKYFEVINEPVFELIQNEKREIKAAEIFEYHNVVAKKVRELNPEMKIGGQCDATPDLEYDDFGFYHKYWEDFFKITGKEMDFYSIHLYDKGWDKGFQYLKKGSNIEAILDLLEQGSKLTIGEVKPFLVSEYGAFDLVYYQEPYEKARDWYNLKAFSSMMMNFMSRPHLIEKSMPFLIMKANWWQHESGQPYPYRLLRQENGKWVYTELAKFFELWSDVNGTRYRTTTSDIDIQNDVYIDGNKMYLVLDNLDFEERDVEIALENIEQNKVLSTKTKHLFMGKETPELAVNVSEGAVKTFKIGAEAAVILEYTFEKPVVPKQKFVAKKYYAEEYLKLIDGAALTFHVNAVAKKDKGFATLRLGLARDHGKSLQPNVVINGHKLDVSADVRGYDQSTRKTFFGVIEIPVPHQALKDNNVVDVTFPDKGGRVSSMTLQVANAENL